MKLTTVKQLLDAYKKLVASKYPEDVFGDQAEINKVYRQLILAIHPDHFQDDPKSLALSETAFELLSEFKGQADRKVKAGTYGNKIIDAPPRKEPFRSSVIEIGGKRFTLVDNLSLGDICDLYICSIANGALDYKAVFKIVKQNSDNDLVENEVKILRKLYPDTAKDEKFYRFLPKLMDSFIIRGPGSQRRVNIFPWFSEHRSLVKVLQVFPDGIDYRDAVWMFKRILHCIGFAHQSHVIHGAIIPPHVMIHPVDHGAKIIDWSYALDLSNTTTSKAVTFYDYLTDDTFLNEPHIKAISAGYKDYYPPEIFKKETPTSATDIYMAAKCAVALLGGNVTTNSMPNIPSEVKSFLDKCLEKDNAKRFQNAWDAHEELDNILTRVVGKRKYRPFPMPLVTD